MLDLLIENIHARTEDTEILKGVNLNVSAGEVVAVMGPNGSGKSTLAYVIMGHPAYEVTHGSIVWNDSDVLKLKPEERAKAGIFLSFQNPPEIAGVSIGNFLRLSYNAIHTPQLSVKEFISLLRVTCERLAIPLEFTTRSVNEGFSGGERKRVELLQLAILRPHLAILDEIDSGLDIDGLKMVGSTIEVIRRENPQMSLLLITHYQRLLDVIPPHRVLIMKHGKVVKESDISVLSKIEQQGYHAF